MEVNAGDLFSSQALYNARKGTGTTKGLESACLNRHDQEGLPWSSDHRMLVLPMQSCMNTHIDSVVQG